MSLPADTNLATSLLAIHAVITRGLSVGLENCRRFSAGDALEGDARGGFADYIRTLAAVLDEHHLSEDEIAFPYFEPLIPEVPYDRLRADHQRIIPRLRVLESTSASWSAGNEEALARMTATLTSLEAIWHPHIEIEEGGFTAERLGELIAPEEHLRLNQEFVDHSMKNISEPYLYLPFVIFNTAPEERSSFTDRMPPVLTRQLIPVDWKEQWSPMKPYLLE